MALLVGLSLCACKREQRSLRTDPPVAAALAQVAVMPGGINGTPPEVDRALGHPSQTNAYELSQGKRLYTWFNCEGCHADGGGAFGPALMDGWWRYGPDPVSIFVSIREGRPRGMPAFANRLTTEQIWQLTGYIQSLGALSAQTAAPNRNDDMQTRPAENRAPVAADLAPPS
ncbi:MAG: c-type cytochrome [Acetobacteraceae bacterium]